jgi:hypothetical protein
LPLLVTPAADDDLILHRPRNVGQPLLHHPALRLHRTTSRALINIIISVAFHSHCHSFTKQPTNN